MGFLPRKSSDDDVLADRIRQALGPRADVGERKMFGGLAFLVGGHMMCGVNRGELMVRVGPDQYGEALAQPEARPMDFTGRPLKGFVYVDERGFATQRKLASWVARGLRFVESLPPK